MNEANPRSYVMLTLTMEGCFSVGLEVEVLGHPRVACLLGLVYCLGIFDFRRLLGNSVGFNWSFSAFAFPLRPLCLVDLFHRALPLSSVNPPLPSSCSCLVVLVLAVVLPSSSASSALYCNANYIQLN